MEHEGMAYWLALAFGMLQECKNVLESASLASFIF